MIGRLQKVDDIYLNGKILKNTLIKGVSTAKNAEKTSWTIIEFQEC